MHHLESRCLIPWLSGLAPKFIGCPEPELLKPKIVQDATRTIFILNSFGDFQGPGDSQIATAMENKSLRCYNASTYALNATNVRLVSDTPWLPTQLLHPLILSLASHLLCFPSVENNGKHNLLPKNSDTAASYPWTQTN